MGKFPSSWEHFQQCPLLWKHFVSSCHIFWVSFNWCNSCWWIAKELLYPFHFWEPGLPTWGCATTSLLFWSNIDVYRSEHCCQSEVHDFLVASWGLSKIVYRLDTPNDTLYVRFTGGQYPMVRWPIVDQRQRVKMQTTSWGWQLIPLFTMGF